MKRLIVALLLAFLGAAPSPGVQAQVELGTDGGHPGGDGAGGDGGTPIPPSLPALANPQAPSDAPTPEKNRTPPTAPLPQEALPAMELTLDPAGPISVGDRLTMNLTVDARRGDEITIPKDQSVAPLEILGTSHHQTEASTGRTVHQFRVDLLALDVGTIPIPPLTIRVVTQEGIVGEVQTPASEVEVRSVLGNEPNATPKGPSQPVEVIEDDYTLAYVAAAIGAIALTILLTWLFLRWWRNRRREEAPPPPPRPPWETAWTELAKHRREKRRYLDEHRETEWIDGVSDTIRRYLGDRFGFDGLESTSDEVLAHLRARSPKGVQVAEVATVLGNCDLIKFAKVVPNEAECDEVLDAAVHLVEATRPSAPSTHDVEGAP